MHTSQTPSTSEPRRPLLATRNLVKRYGAVEALRGVDFEIRPGEIVGLVGDNGAGKSTLVKILAGVTEPTSGYLEFDGQAVALESPVSARRLGIETVYQDLGLCENLSVAENIFLGREPTRGVGPLRWVDKRRMAHEAATVLAGLSINIPKPRVKVSLLSGGQRQGVALARARLWEQRLVMLDEPTAALGVQESRKSVEAIGQLQQAGAAILLISHDIPMLREIAHRVVVLRRGVKVADVTTSSVTEHDIVSLITGAATLSGAEPSIAATKGLR